MFLIRFELLQVAFSVVSQIVVSAVFVSCSGKTVFRKSGLTAACINTKKAIG